MLRFILGKSGSGKSTETLKIAGELADSNLPVMLIVPDQSTFECEKTLLDVFGAKKAEKVLVFGFSRLCKYVFELTGNSADNVIDEGTRAVVMRTVFCAMLIWTIHAIRLMPSRQPSRRKLLIR